MRLRELSFVEPYVSFVEPHVQSKPSQSCRESAQKFIQVQIRVQQDGPKSSNVAMSKSSCMFDWSLDPMRTHTLTAHADAKINTDFESGGTVSACSRRSPRSLEALDTRLSLRPKT